MKTMSHDTQKENCVIDARVSDRIQVQGDSLENQEMLGRILADRRGWNIVKVFSKTHSATTSVRDDLDEIKEYIRASKVPINHYICKSIDRLTRMGYPEYVKLKEELEAMNVQVWDTYGIIQPKQNTLEHLGFQYKWSVYSPSEAAEMFAAYSGKQEAREILTRLITAEVNLVREGYKVRPPNDGFLNEKVLIDGKKKVIEVPDPNRAKFFVAMFEMRAQGIADTEIVERINAMGFKTKTRDHWNKKRDKVIGKREGKPLTVKQLQRYIQRPIYAGVKCEKWTKHQPIRAQYDGLISIELFNRANLGKVFIEEREDGTLRLRHNYSPYGNVKAKRLKHNPQYIWKCVLCDVCGSPMLGSASKGKSGKTYGAYHCGGVKNGKRAHVYFRVPQQEFETNVKRYLDHLQFQEGFLRSFEYVLIQKYRKREKEVVQEAAQINQSVADLKAEQASKLDAYEKARSDVIRRKLEEQIEALETKIKDAVATREEVEVNERSIKSFIKYARYTMEHPAEILTALDDWRARQAILELIFEVMPTYQEILNGTPKLTPVFALSEQYKVGKTQSVTLPGIEPGLPP